MHHPKYALENVAIEGLSSQRDAAKIRLLSVSAQKQTVYFGAKKIAGAVVRPIELNFEVIPEPLQAKLQATTNASGEVELAGFPGISTGVVEVRAKGLGTQVLNARGNRLDGIKTAPLGVLHLRGVGTVRGRVIADDRALIKGLKLRFESKDDEGEVDAAVGRVEVTEFAPDGSFEIPEFTSGKLNFSEFREALIPYQLRRPCQEAMRLEAGRVCKLNLPLERIVKVVGEVHFEDGTPVPDASVSYYSPLQAAGNTHTDKSGKYELQVLPGDFGLYVSSIAALEERLDESVSRIKKWEQKNLPELDAIEIPKTTADFKLPTITILKQRTVKGTLVNKDRKPLPNETVFVYRTNANGNRNIFASVISDSNGEFEFPICAPANSYEYLHDHDKGGLVQDLVSKFVNSKPMAHPSPDSHEASLVEDGDSIVLQSK